MKKKENKSAEEIPTVKMLDNLIEQKWGQPTSMEYIQTITRHNLSVWIYELITRLKLGPFEQKERKNIDFELCQCTGKLSLTFENHIIYCDKCRKRFIP